MQPHEQLELDFQEWSGSNHYFVACSSGTAALHLAFQVLAEHFSPKKKPYVLSQDYNMIAGARGIKLAGYTPLFFDCHRWHLTANDDSAADVLASTIEDDWSLCCGLLSTHIYGRVNSQSGLRELAQAGGFEVIEDMAEVHGVKHHPKSFAACWSFYRNKIIAGYEGGMVAFRERDDAERARSLRSLGFTDRHDFEHRPGGHNYRMSDVHATAVLDSLQHAIDNIERRTRIEMWYDSLIDAKFRAPIRDVTWVYDVRLVDYSRRQQFEIVKQLNGKGIAARMGFLPMSFQPEFRTLPEFMTEEETGNPQAALAAQEVMYLPVDPTMRHEDVEHIVDTFHNITAHNPPESR